MDEGFERTTIVPHHWRGPALFFVGLTVLVIVWTIYVMVESTGLIGVGLLANLHRRSKPGASGRDSEAVHSWSISFMCFAALSTLALCAQLANWVLDFGY